MIEIISKIFKWIKSELKVVIEVIAALLIAWQVYEYGYRHGKDICESELGALNKQFAILKDSLIFNAQIPPSANEMLRANLRKGTAMPLFEGQCVIAYRNVTGKDLKRKAEIQVLESEPKERKISQVGKVWLFPGEYTSFAVESATPGYDIKREIYSVDFLGFYDDIEKDLAKIVVYYKTYEFIDPKKDGDMIVDSTVVRKDDSLRILKGAVQIMYKNIEIQEGRKWPVVTLSGKEVRQFRSAFRSPGDIIPFYQETNFYAIDFLGFIDTVNADKISLRLYKINK